MRRLQRGEDVSEDEDEDEDVLESQQTHRMSGANEGVAFASQAGGGIVMPNESNESSVEGKNLPNTNL